MPQLAAWLIYVLSSERREDSVKDHRGSPRMDDLTATPCILSRLD